MIQGCHFFKKQKMWENVGMFRRMFLDFGQDLSKIVKKM